MSQSHVWIWILSSSTDTISHEWARRSCGEWCSNNNTKTKQFLYPEKKNNRRVNKHGWHDEIIIFACKDMKSTLTTSNEDKTLSKQDKF